jgi:hypothetical protein
LGTSSAIRVRRASWAVSRTSGFGHGYPSSTQAAFRKPVSYGALWATHTAPSANWRKPGSTSSIFGAGSSIASVIPVSTVMNGGSRSAGCTSVANSPSTSPLRTFTAPISVMPPPLGAPPVVSRSTTMNVVPKRDAARGSSKSASRVSCTPARYARGTTVLCVPAKVLIGTAGRSRCDTGEYVVAG